MNNGLVRPGGPGSERILQCKLYLARVASALHAAEILSVRDVAVRVGELSGVEDVEELSAELDGMFLADLRDLLERHIPILHARSAADGAFRGTESTVSSCGER